MQTDRRRRLPHRDHPTAPPDATAAAYDLIDRIATSLEMAILVHDVDGEGPVHVRGSFIYGRVNADAQADGATEAAAITELARKAVIFRGRDEQWFLRYGLGPG